LYLKLDQFVRLGWKGVGGRDLIPSGLAPDDEQSAKLLIIGTGELGITTRRCQLYHKYV
jgi:hypothetical protein